MADARRGTCPPLARPDAPPFVVRPAFADAETTVIVAPLAPTIPWPRPTPRPAARLMWPPRPALVPPRNTAAHHARSWCYLALALLTGLLAPIAFTHATDLLDEGTDDAVVRAELVVGALVTFATTTAVAYALTRLLIGD